MITTNYALVEGYKDSEKNQCLVRVSQDPTGCLVTFKLVDVGTASQFFLCQKDGEVYVVGIPSARWIEDLKSGGFQIRAVIDHKRTQQ